MRQSRYRRLAIRTTISFGVLALASDPPSIAAQAGARRPELRILLFYDMEGASGITRGAMFDSRVPETYATGREFLTRDVNSVVAGLFEGGATAVDVFNSHGSGGDTLVSRDRLDPRARILSRPNPQLAYDPASGLGDSGYAAVVAVAMHDKPRSGGFSPHAVRIGTTPVVNGVGIGETELVAYAVGVAGIPMILASGDDVLGRSLTRTMPWLEYVAVKRTTGEAVDPLPAAEAEARLRLAATRAVRALGEPGRMRPMRAATPIRAGVLPSYPAWIPPALGDLPGIEMRGDTATFVVADYPSAYRGIRLLMRLAANSAEGLMVDELRRTAEGRRLAREAMDSVMARWAAFERGRWEPPRP